MAGGDASERVTGLDVDDGGIAEHRGAPRQGDVVDRLGLDVGGQHRERQQIGQRTP